MDSKKIKSAMESLAYTTAYNVAKKAIAQDSNCVNDDLSNMLKADLPKALEVAQLQEPRTDIPISPLESRIVNVEKDLKEIREALQTLYRKGKKKARSKEQAKKKKH